MRKLLEAFARGARVALGRQDWSTYLPAGADWVHLWSGDHYGGGQEVTVSAPLGKPPVFYRAGSSNAALFAGIPSL